MNIVIPNGVCDSKKKGRANGKHHAASREEKLISKGGKNDLPSHHKKTTQDSGRPEQEGKGIFATRGMALGVELLKEALIEVCDATYQTTTWSPSTEL